MAATLPPAPPSPPSMPPGPPPPPPPPAVPAPTLEPLPLEKPGYPALEGIYETAKLFLLNPSDAFARMSTSGDIGRPLLFAVVLGWVGIVAAQLYQLLIPRFGMPWRYFPEMERSLHFALRPVFTIGMMVLAPVFVLLGVFIWAAILHLFLLVVGAGEKGFTTTVRVVCYAGVVQIAQVLPLCGGLLALVWSIVLEIVGLAVAHRTSQGKAAVAVLLPIALCCACAAVLAVAFGAAILAAVGASR
jgi:hypothetical protein